MKFFTSINRLSFYKGSLESMVIIVLLFSFVVLANKAEAQSLYVTTGGTVLAQNAAVTIAGNALVTTGATPLVGATVSVSSNFVTGQDVLGLSGAASGGISNSYNATTGVLTLSGSATAADYQATLQKVTYTNTSATPNTSVRVITCSLNAALPYTGNGHYFEFISSTNISWTDANTAANTKTYFGLQGYLATITSLAENTFVYSKINAAGWLGGSDAASEGVWKWVCGPETGTQFWQGGIAGSAVGGNFAYWHSGQPDNSGGEHYLDFWNGDHWNDYPNVATGSIAGYVVEYGGMAGDPVIHISDFVTVDFAPKVGSLATTAGAGIKWYDASSGGNLLPSTTVLVSGNHYYASQTVNGLESTSRLDVVAALNLAAPVAAAHTASPTQIVWNWTAVSGATGYKWSSTNDYASATDIPSGTSRTETGLSCNTAYTRYVWAYNATASCVSRPALLTQTTSACFVAPAVTTLAVTNIGTTTATFNGNISAINGANVTTRGFKYSTTNGFDPATTGTNISETGSYGIGAFSLSPSGLATTTTYYVRAYATNSAGTTYGDQVSFITAIQTEFYYTGGVQTFTVPAGITSVTIEAWGAEGGTSTAQSGGTTYAGGKGAYIKGSFSVTPGQIISLLVAGKGSNGTCGAGGGGGSFTVKSGTLLIAAGGGGGGFHCTYYGGAIGGNGSTSTSGGNGIQATGENTPQVGLAGGINGNGGAAYYGGGGGGWLTAGTTTSPPGAGGGAYPGAGGLPGGGYGGGGGYYDGCCGGAGGGGGYSGGSGGTQDGCAGGGGGSFNGGTSQTNTTGIQSGNGQILITY